MFDYSRVVNQLRITKFLAEAKVLIYNHTSKMQPNARISTFVASKTPVTFMPLVTYLFYNYKLAA